VLRALAIDASIVREPRDWSLGEKFAREAVAMAEQVDSPADLSAALSALSDVLGLRGSWRECAQITLRRIAINDAAGLGDVQERATALIDVAGP
jgi:hypothetical protein